MYVQQAHVDLFREVLRDAIMETTVRPWADVTMRYAGYFITPYGRCVFSIGVDSVILRLTDLPTTPYYGIRGGNFSYIPMLQPRGRVTAKQIENYICDEIRYGFTRHLLGFYQPTSEGLPPTSIHPCLRITNGNDSIALVQTGQLATSLVQAG